MRVKGVCAVAHNILSALIGLFFARGFFACFYRKFYSRLGIPFVITNYFCDKNSVFADFFCKTNDIGGVFLFAFFKHLFINGIIDRNADNSQNAYDYSENGHQSRAVAGRIQPVATGHCDIVYAIFNANRVIPVRGQISGQNPGTANRKTGHAGSAAQHQIIVRVHGNRASASGVDIASRKQVFDRWRQSKNRFAYERPSASLCKKWYRDRKKLF